MWIDDANALLSDFINTINDKKNIFKVNKDHLNSLIWLEPKCLRQLKFKACDSAQPAACQLVTSFWCT